MKLPSIYLLLADDDKDDRLFFKEALDELSLSVNLTTVNDGEELMQFLTKKDTNLPTLIFLDINMPRKNGLECLTEIKLDEKLKKLPVIIFSTSMDPDMINLLYKKGAQHYIHKPSEFSKLKKAIHDVLTLMLEENDVQPVKEKFIVQV